MLETAAIWDILQADMVKEFADAAFALGKGEYTKSPAKDPIPGIMSFFKKTNAYVLSRLMTMLKTNWQARSGAIFEQNRRMARNSQSWKDLISTVILLLTLQRQQRNSLKNIIEWKSPRPKWRGFYLIPHKENICPIV